jgi:hypothetical protein
MAQAAAGLVRRLGSASPSEQLEAARGLEELAASPGGARRIQGAGGVSALVRLLQGGGSEALQTAAASALERMAVQGTDMAREICTAGAGQALAQRLPSSRSPELIQVAIGLMAQLIHAGMEHKQQLADELAASPGCLERLAQLAADPSQDTATQMLALRLLAGGHMLGTSRYAVAAAVAPHAAALIQRLSPQAAAGDPEAWKVQLAVASLVSLLANDSAELAAHMVAAGVVPRLVGLMGAASPQQQLQMAAVAALERLVAKQPSAARQLAAMQHGNGALVQLMASHPPPASYQQAWGRAEAATSTYAAALLVNLIRVDAAQTGRAVAAGALPMVTRVLHWGALRLELLASRGQWEEGTEAICSIACDALLYLLFGSRPSSTVTSALQAAGLTQLVPLVLQHCRSQDALHNASRLLALLRNPSIQSSPALNLGAAEVLRQLQPGGHPDRAAAIAALLSELSGEAQQQEGGGSGAGAAPARPSSSSSGAAQQAGRQKEAAPAECAACHVLPPAGRKFQVCAGCRAVRYCSPACQKAGWRSGHKAACRAVQGGARGKA